MEKFSFSTPQGTTDIFYCKKISVPDTAGLKAIYITDSNTISLLKKAENFSKDVPIVEIKPGEAQKNFDSVCLILNSALKNNLDRTSIFVGFGGGVICDLTAFASSIYMRGARCKLVPTTLLAMADAAIGGKTAVNFSSCKNIAGTFFKAEEIYISAACLKTLSDKEYFCGLAEILKIGLLNSKELYGIIKKEKQNLLSKNSKRLSEIIKFACSAKAAAVSEDFYEKGMRVFLNFGHTFAHALEALTGFSGITHGEAVAWGIGRALALGCRLNKTDSNYAEEIFALLKYFGWSVSAVPVQAQKIMEAQNIPAERQRIFFSDSMILKMKNDKKNVNGKIKLVMQNNLNVNFLYEASENEIRQVLI